MAKSKISQLERDIIKAFKEHPEWTPCAGRFYLKCGEKRYVCGIAAVYLSQTNKKYLRGNSFEKLLDWATYNYEVTRSFIQGLMFGFDNMRKSETMNDSYSLGEKLRAKLKPVKVEWTGVGEVSEKPTLELRPNKSSYNNY